MIKFSCCGCLCLFASLPQDGATILLKVESCMFCESPRASTVLRPVFQLLWGDFLHEWSSQQSSKEEYKPWKWGATARYYDISYKDHVTNEEVRGKIQQAIEPHKDLLPIVKRRRLQWYGHVSRSSGLGKTILQGTATGGRRQGGQRKRWEDNIRKWTGLEFAKSQRAVDNRERWRELVARLSVVPKRPSRLRDRW